MSSNTPISYLNEVHKYVLEGLKKKSISSKQDAGDEIYRAFFLQSIDVQLEALKEINDPSAIEYFRDWASRIITGFLLSTHPAYANMKYPDEVSVDETTEPLCIPDHDGRDCVLKTTDAPAVTDETKLEPDGPAQNTRSKTVAKAVAAKAEAKSDESQVVEDKSTHMPKPDGPAQNTRSKTTPKKDVKRAVPDAPKKTERPTEAKLDDEEFPTLDAARTPAPSKKLWADETESAERMDAATLAARNALMEKLSWSGRIKAASMTLAEIEVMLAEESKRVPETPVKKAIVPVPDAPKKEKTSTPHLGTPKQLDFSNDTVVRPVLVEEPGWQPARKSKIAKAVAPASGKTSVITEEYCAKHLKTANQKPDRMGAVTSAGWLIAKMAGKVPVIPEKFDWYARKLDENGHPIGWIVLASDAEGNPTSWRINRASQFVHTLKTSPEGKKYLAHHEICDVEAADGSWSKQSFPVSVDYLLWTLCPGQLRHKLGPCPKA